MRFAFLLLLTLSLVACGGSSRPAAPQIFLATPTDGEADPVSDDILLKTVYCAVSDQNLVNEVTVYYKNHPATNSGVQARNYQHAVLEQVDLMQAYLKDQDIDLSDHTSLTPDILKFIDLAFNDAKKDKTLIQTPYSSCLSECKPGNDHLPCLDNCKKLQTEKERRASSCMDFGYKLTRSQKGSSS